jgi:sialic acid synthase SpsE
MFKKSIFILIRRVNMLILEFGSGDTCKNDQVLIKDMIDSLSVIKNKQDVIIKWQLFDWLPHVEALKKENYDYAYKYAKDAGFQTTASIFDLESLDFLLRYDPPFIKLACQTTLYNFRKYNNRFLRFIPNEIPIIISYDKIESLYAKVNRKIDCLCCIPLYPAIKKDYTSYFSCYDLKKGISDHTIGFELWREYKPAIYERHYKLKGQENFLDAAWSATIDDLLSEGIIE